MQKRTSEPGTTAIELINDLEELLENSFYSTTDLHDGIRDIIREHKSRMFLTVPEDSEPPKFAEVLAVLPGLPQLGPTLFEVTETECQKFIEQKVNGG